MIVKMSFEEITVLNSVSERLLSSQNGGGIAAPPEILSALEGQLPLTGDISVTTLSQQRNLVRALGYILDHQKRQMDELIVDLYVGADDAVNAYFDYANVLTVLARLEPIGREMEAIIELMTGEPPTRETAEQVTFLD
jgi:hypothetical protein